MIMPHSNFDINSNQEKNDFEKHETKAKIVVKSDTNIDLLEFTNFLIITIGVFLFLTLSFVLVLVLVCQHRGRKVVSEEGSICESSTSSCESASQLSESTIVSFNTQPGEARRSYRDFDDLACLDNDYFLSSLEDISVQV